MILHEARNLLDCRERGKRLIALDLGEKTIGVALSDPGWLIATPLVVIRRTNRNADVASVISLASQYQAVGIIVGLPVNMNGTHGPQAVKMQEFAYLVSETSQLAIALWDERLSTIAVKRTLLEADMSRKRRSEVVDKLAATYILQGLLDYLGKIDIE